MTGTTADGEGPGLLSHDIIGAMREQGEFRRFREHLAPGVTLSHYTADVEWEVRSLRGSRWTVTANFSVAATLLKGREYSAISDGFYETRETYVSIHGGFAVNYAVSADCDVFVGGRDYIEVNDDLERTMFESVEKGSAPLTSALRTFPLAMGVRFGLP